MKINTNTWHYRLWKASFTHKWDVPDETDLCRYCHRVFWQLLGIAALCGAILFCAGTLLVGAAMILYKGFWLNPGIAFPVTGILAAVITVLVLYKRWLKGSPKHSTNDANLASSWVAARKQKVCPLVEFTDEDNG